LLVAEVDFGRSAAGTALRLAEILCTEALASCAAPGLVNAWFDERVRRALTRIHEAPEKPWTVSALARAAAMSPSRFAARFRQAAGQSPMAYVNAVRMNQACRLLQGGSAPVSAIAHEVGYEDVAAFTRSFKRLTGETPARWRSQLQ
jgi:AraC-like DNA-binding protein